MTIGEANRIAKQTLEEHGIPDPQEDARLILAYVTGLSGMEVRLTRAAQALTDEQERRFESLLLSRVQRRPLQYVLGEQWFYGRRFLVDERVLSPRQETESLCEVGVRFLASRPNGTALDLCTGSGAIAVVLACECPGVRVFASDLSADALELAHQNAALHHAEISFFQGNLFEALPRKRFDLILSNPPYIPSEECSSLQPEVLWEPLLALDGGKDGLDFYRRIAKEALDFLTPDGMLAVETGDGEAAPVVALLQAAGRYREISIHRDLYGKERIVSARAVS